MPYRRIAALFGPPIVFGIGFLISSTMIREDRYSAIYMVGICYTMYVGAVFCIAFLPNESGTFPLQEALKEQPLTIYDKHTQRPFSARSLIKLASCATLFVTALVAIVSFAAWWSVLFEL